MDHTQLSISAVAVKDPFDTGINKTLYNIVIRSFKQEQYMVMSIDRC